MSIKKDTVLTALVAGAAAAAVTMVATRVFSKDSQVVSPPREQAILTAEMQAIKTRAAALEQRLDKTCLELECMNKARCKMAKQLEIAEEKLAENNSHKESMKSRLAASWSSLPKRIILMRHGESEGNVDRSGKIYECKSDFQIELTPKGVEQAKKAGERLKKLIGDEQLACFMSPFERTQETLLAASLAFSPTQIASVHIDPRIREREFGNLQEHVDKSEKTEYRAQMVVYLKAKKEYEAKKKADPACSDPEPSYPKYKNTDSHEHGSAEAARLGRFFYRYQNGESCADVYDRSGDFIETLFGDGYLYNRFTKAGGSCNGLKGNKCENALVVTHGLTMRLILMRYFQMSVDTFHSIWNGGNCDTWVLRKNDETKRYQICPEECHPKRAPWATREVTVHYLKDGVSFERPYTIVDYISIKQPRTGHTEQALKQMVEGHNVKDIGKYHICSTTANRIRGTHPYLKTKSKDGNLVPLQLPIIPLANFDDKKVLYIDWWRNNDANCYPSHNVLSAAARKLRTNLMDKRKQQQAAAKACGRPPSLSVEKSVAAAEAAPKVCTPSACRASKQEEKNAADSNK